MILFYHCSLIHGRCHDRNTQTIVPVGGFTLDIRAAGMSPLAREFGRHKIVIDGTAIGASVRVSRG